MSARLPLDLPQHWNPYRSFVPCRRTRRAYGQEGRVELTVLAIPGCPNVPVLQQRLAAVLADWPGVMLQWRVIADAAEAARWRMHGSPTLLVNGHDPFAEVG